jgi:hypothetical protein
MESTRKGLRQDRRTVKSAKQIVLAKLFLELLGELSERFGRRLALGVCLAEQLAAIQNQLSQ